MIQQKIVYYDEKNGDFFNFIRGNNHAHNRMLDFGWVISEILYKTNTNISVLYQRNIEI